MSFAWGQVECEVSKKYSRGNVAKESWKCKSKSQKREGLKAMDLGAISIKGMRCKSAPHRQGGR